MKGVIDGIRTDLEAAAAIDGAPALTTLRRIVLPLATPGAAVTAWVVFLASYVEVMFTLVLARGAIHTLPLAIAG